MKQRKNKDEKNHLYLKIIYHPTLRSHEKIINSLIHFQA
jgi:hypothetical protein